MKGNESTISKKENVLQALEAALGVVTTACKKINISRKTFYQWYKQDEEFKKRVDECKEIALDFAESKLFEMIKNKNATAIIFYLKTQGKGRGYIEKTQQDITTKGESLNKKPSWFGLEQKEDNTNLS